MKLKMIQVFKCNVQYENLVDLNFCRINVGLYWDLFKIFFEIFIC